MTVGHFFIIDFYLNSAVSNAELSSAQFSIAELSSLSFFANGIFVRITIIHCRLRVLLFIQFHIRQLNFVLPRVLRCFLSLENAHIISFALRYCVLRSHGL